MKSIKYIIITILLLLFYFLFLFINNLNFNNIENLENIENNYEKIKEKPKINKRKDLDLKSPEELKKIIYDLDNELSICKVESYYKEIEKLNLKKNIKNLKGKIKKLELELANKNKSNNNSNVKSLEKTDEKNEIENTGIIKPRWGYYKDTNEPAMWNGYSDPNIIEYNN